MNDETDKVEKESLERDVVELRRRFFDANPAAKESDFQTLLPKLREQEMLENMKRQQAVAEMLDRQASAAEFIQTKIIESFEQMSDDEWSKIPVEERLKFFNEMKQFRKESK